MIREIRNTLLLAFIIFSPIFFGCSSESKETQLKTHPALEMLPVANGLGVNIHFYEGNEKDLSMLKESGVGIIRMDVSWGGIEKTKGQYDFSRHDKLVEDLEKLGIRIIFIIDYGNPLYDDGLAPHTEEGRKAYANFCSVLAERYKDKNIIWELWNEPNLDRFWKPKVNIDDYMAFCKTVVPIIRSKDNDACIIAPATSAFDMRFMESCFEQGLLDLVDGVSVHPYRNSELSPETTFNEYKLLSLLIEQHKPEGKYIPILSGEWGYSTTNLSRKLQGKYLARQWLSNLAYNVPTSIWYDWHDDGKDPEESEHNFGTVTWDYKEKPSFVAMRTLIGQFKGYKAVGRVSLGHIDDYLLLFQNGDNIKVALWSISHKHIVSLKKGIKVSSTVNYLGEELPLSGNKQIRISDEPTYLSIEKPFPEWIKVITKTNNLTIEENHNVVRSILNKSDDNELAKEIIKLFESRSPLNHNSSLYSLLLLAEKSNSDDALEIYYMILQKGNDLLSQKQALYKIAVIGSEKSMPKVAAVMKNPMLVKDASLYYLGLAYKYVNEKQYKKAENILVDAVRLSPPRYAVERVLDKMQKVNKEFDTTTFRTIAKSAGFINTWKVIGPFLNKNNSGQHKRFTPEWKLDFNQKLKVGSSYISWQDVELEGAFPVIPFAKMYGRIEGVAYAYSTITLSKNMHAILKIGSNDGVVCWVNGKKVHEKFIGRPLTVDEDVVEVNLRKGKNEILLKVLNRGNNWEASLRVCDYQGIPIDLNKLEN